MLYNTTNYEIDEQLSKRIVSLRFLLTVFVVLIHSMPKEIGMPNGILVLSIPKYVNTIENIFSNIMGAAAVPLFFLFSSFFLYAKDKPFIKIINSKIKTIFIPYILWTLLFVLVFYIGQTIPYTKPYFSQSKNIIKNFTTLDWIDIFLGKFSYYPYPFIYQFWFLRDLMILIILCKLIKKIIDFIPFTFFSSIIYIYIASTFI